MTDERRYSEKEIAAIFKQAAQAQEKARRQLGHSEGLTLAELQEIGKEAGIMPAFIARSAAAVEHSAPAPPPATYFGMPVSAARTVDLPRAFSEDDWGQLVADLRDTFHATGHVRREGSLRQWNNGNLHALVEPTASGHRLHLRTRKGNAQSSFIGGMAALGMGLVLLLMGVLSGKLVTEVAVTVMAGAFMLGGLGRMGLTAYRLPRWAKEREHQMEAVAGRAVERTAGRQVRVRPSSETDPLLEIGTSEEQRPAGHRQHLGRTRS